MSRVMRVVVMAALLVIAYGSAAQADIIFCPESSGTAACDPNGTTGNPDENLLFNDEDSGVVLEGVTVTGRTNTTDTLIDITDLDGEELAVQTSGGGSGGQAKVTGDDDGSFSNILLSAQDPTIGFTEFEANLLVVEGSGTVTVTITNQFGATEVGTYEVDEAGQNFFNLLAYNDQLIKSIEIEAEDGLLLSFIEQIRLGGVSEITENGAEPAALLLFGTALVAGGRRLRRRLSVPVTA